MKPFRTLCRVRALVAGAALSLISAAALAQVQAVAPWLRPTVTGQAAGGGFVELRNTGPSADRLLGGSTPVAERLELHSMAMQGDVMRMRPVDSVPIPAGGSVALAPGGLHLMLTGLKAPLKVGDKVPVVLRFEKAGELKLEFTVAQGKPGGAAAASAADAMHDGAMHGHKP